jgi:hypothetical protein
VEVLTFVARRVLYSIPVLEASANDVPSIPL